MKLSIVRRWKRDALELVHDMKAIGCGGESSVIQANRVAQLALEYEDLLREFRMMQSAYSSLTTKKEEA